VSILVTVPPLTPPRFSPRDHLDDRDPEPHPEGRGPLLDPLGAHLGTCALV
jgi:hypothetical protein